MDAGDGDKNGIKLFFELIMELGWFFEIIEFANASHAKKRNFSKYMRTSKFGATQEYHCMDQY